MYRSNLAAARLALMGLRTVVMPTRRKYEDLAAWQKALMLVDRVYDVSENWPKAETYRLVDQVRRSAVSVPANIAEGQGRTGPNEYPHHLSIAYGSLMEMETLLIIANRRAFTTEAAHDSMLELSSEVGRLILSTITSLRRYRSNN
jgi:four helix bundle protein